MCCSFSINACSRDKTSRSLLANVDRCPLTMDSLSLYLETIIQRMRSGERTFFPFRLH